MTKPDKKNKTKTEAKKFDIYGLAKVLGKPTADIDALVLKKLINKEETQENFLKIYKKYCE